MEPTQQGGNATKYIIGLVIIAIVIIAISLAARNQTTTAPTENAATTQTSAETVVSTTPEPTIPAQTVIVEYTDQGFMPKEVSIKVGDTVKFVNKSSEGMWVGSAMHPNHVVYSGTELKDHCPDTAGTAFDQCGTTNEYSFTFNKVGSWGYHNHVSAKMFGKVIVSAN